MVPVAAPTALLFDFDSSLEVVNSTFISPVEIFMMRAEVALDPVDAIEEGTGEVVSIEVDKGAVVMGEVLKSIEVVK